MPQRKPTKILQMQGVSKTHSDRMNLRKDEFKPTGELGPPPQGMIANARRVWIEIVESMPAGILTNADRFIMEMTCVLMAEFKYRKMKMPSGQMNTLRQCLSLLGLSPADRSKVLDPKGPREDGDDGWGQA